MWTAPSPASAGRVAMRPPVRDRTAFGAGTAAGAVPSPRTRRGRLPAVLPGPPDIITRNDHSLGLANGDTGVLVRGPQGPLAAIQTGQGVRTFSPWRLADVETMHAMTVHKAQGSEADDVTVLVPAPGPRSWPRAAVHGDHPRPPTATVIGSRDAIRSAVTTPIERSSALTERPEQSANVTLPNANQPFYSATSRITTLKRLIDTWAARHAGASLQGLCLSAAIVPGAERSDPLHSPWPRPHRRTL